MRFKTALILIVSLTVATMVETTLAQAPFSDAPINLVNAIEVYRVKKQRTNDQLKNIFYSFGKKVNPSNKLTNPIQLSKSSSYYAVVFLGSTVPNKVFDVVVKTGFGVPVKYYELGRARYCSPNSADSRRPRPFITPIYPSQSLSQTGALFVEVYDGNKKLASTHVRVEVK